MGRSEHELDILDQISQILGDGLELETLFGRMMSVLRDRLLVQRASLVLMDRVTDQLKTVAALGLTPAEQERGRYAVGEGVTGGVMKTGEPAIIPDVAKHPEFLNRTKARRLKPDDAQSSPEPDAGPICFICVPVEDADETVGTISIDKPFESRESLTADARLLRIIAGMISQTIRLHHLMQVEKDRWTEEKRRLNDNLRSKYQFENIIGSSPAMNDVLSMIGQVATSRATVLLLGETGCGKELIAKAVHYNSPRREKPLVRVNCGALSAQLLESELFGHVKGAFTGAVRDKLGRFEAADGGTLFLDEVGTLDMQLQVKLLRVLQEREFERVGDHLTQKADVRVIAATNLDLEKEVKKGNFREDLYYRLNVVTVHLPPLRGRREDIPELIDHFLQQYNRENNRNVHAISRDVMNTLLRYPWPGNVRELENCIERVVVLSQSDEFSESLLPLQIRLFAQSTRHDPAGEDIEALCEKLAEQAVKEFAVYDGRVYDMTIHEVERHLLSAAMLQHDNVKTRTADFLGINRNTLNKKVKDLGLDG